eukprot:1856340-Heterocapsa_arctica.AAC.1
MRTRMDLLALDVQYPPNALKALAAASSLLVLSGKKLSWWWMTGPRYLASLAMTPRSDTPVLENC